MAHGNHENKDNYNKVPKKKHLSTPGAGASFHYFNTFDYNNEPTNRAVKYGVFVANAKRRIENYKKYGEHDWLAPHVKGTRYVGTHVNLDTLKKKEADLKDLTQSRKEALKQSLKEIRNQKGNSQLKFADPDEIADGYHNAVRNAIRYQNMDNAKGYAELKTDGNFKRNLGWDE